MEIKYKLTDETKIIVVEGCEIKLHRVELVEDMGSLKKGTKGGWVEKMQNLQEYAWLHEDAMIYGNAVVKGRALLFDRATVCGNAVIYGCVRLFNDTFITGDIHIYGNGELANFTHINASGEMELYTE